MIIFEEAKTIALNNINSDCEILLDSIIEKPYGWYFNYQSKKYIQTGNISEMLVGSGGFLVEKESGNIINFSSAYALKKNFEIYEKGFLRKSLDLSITKIFDQNESVRFLNRLHMTYTEFEIENGIEWKTPKTYNEKQIKKAISNLPCTFQNQNFHYRFDEFQKIDDSKCFEYELREYR